MRGVSSITMSVEFADSSLAEKSCLRMEPLAKSVFG